MARSKICELDSLISEMNSCILFKGFCWNWSTRIAARNSLEQNSCLAVGDVINGSMTLIAGKDACATNMVVMCMAVNDFTDRLVGNIANGILQINIK